MTGCYRIVQDVTGFYSMLKDVTGEKKTDYILFFSDLFLIVLSNIIPTWQTPSVEQVSFGGFSTILGQKWSLALDPDVNMTKTTIRLKETFIFLPEKE